MHKFETEVCRKGYITFAWIPEKVSRVFTKKGHIPVKGFIKDIAFKGMLGPRQGGAAYSLSECRFKKKCPNQCWRFHRN